MKLDKKLNIILLITIVFIIGLFLCFINVRNISVQNDASVGEDVIKRDKNNLDNNKKNNFDSSLNLNSEDRFRNRNSSSSITIIEYFSLDCPTCRKLHDFESQNREYLKSKASFVYRDLPIYAEKLSFEKRVIGECFYKSMNAIKEEKDNEKELKDLRYFDYLDKAFEYYKYKDNKNENNNWLIEKAETNLEKTGQLYGNKYYFDECVKGVQEKKKTEDYKGQMLINQITYTPTILISVNGKIEAKFEGVTGERLVQILGYYYNYFYGDKSIDI